MEETLGIVPARGGSQRLKGKNLATVDGQPLFLHAAAALQQLCTRVVVSTDDDRIETVARIHGYETHRRPLVDSEQTIRYAARSVIIDLDWTGDVLLLQPTVPPTFNLAAWLAKVADHPSVVAGTPAKHILWGSTWDTIGERTNSLPDWPMREIGLYWWKRGHVGQEPVAIVPVDGAAFDIDTPADLETVRRHYGRKRILIRYIADQARGTGHVRRMLTLAQALQHHDVTFCPADYATWISGWPERIHAAGWNSTEWESAVNVDAPADMVITDTLDNDHRPIAPIPWVTFEDRGNASPQSDLTINALYGRHGWLNERVGPDWCVLGSEYRGLPKYAVRDDSEALRVLVLFGGTDPSNLRNKATEALHAIPHTVVLPGQDIPVVELMRNHDLLLTSAGRTVYEAAAVGIPAVVLAQNNREATHVHLGPHHGNVYLGLGRLATPAVVKETVVSLLSDTQLRRELSATARASVDGRGADRIVSEIDRILEER